ncbi:MAG: hypothetical protein BMS9Abin12_2201 [Acidimicrobiia bacterium]|nr:MAG: hypothetical protein BMS9Abin12_2201 [Acidimicrobiia bacterium]
MMALECYLSAHYPHKVDRQRNDAGVVRQGLSGRYECERCRVGIVGLIHPVGGLNVRTFSRHRTGLPILVVTVILIAAACAGGADTSAPETSTVAPSNDAQTNTPAASVGPASALNPAVVERAKSVDEVTTADGAQVMVAIECDAQTGGDLLHAGAVGLPEGIYDGTVDPSVGGSIEFQVGSDGIGSTARQATLDQSTYTVTYADIDGGIEFTLTGCSG